MATADQSHFDETVLAGFEVARAAGTVMASDPSNTEFRAVEGRLGIVVSWHREHYLKKRPNQLRSSEDLKVKVDPDPATPGSGFNFNKAREEELLLDLGRGVTEGLVEVAADAPARRWENPVLVNVSPLAVGHVVIPLACGAVLPQVMTPGLLQACLRSCGMSRYADFRCVFNSRGAFASVNHFHLHGLYLRHCNLPRTGACLPIETAPRRSLVHRGDVHVEILEAPYFLPAVICSSRAQKLQHLSALGSELVLACQELNIPHNLVFRPLFHPTEGLPAGPHAFEVTVIPRKQQRHHDADIAGFNAAVLEICGLIVARSRDKFESLTERDIADAMSEGVALPWAEFDDVLARAGLNASSDDSASRD